MSQRRSRSAEPAHARLAAARGAPLLLTCVAVLSACTTAHDPSATSMLPAPTAGAAVRPDAGMGGAGSPAAGAGASSAADASTSSGAGASAGDGSAQGGGGAGARPTSDAGDGPVTPSILVQVASGASSMEPEPPSSCDPPVSGSASGVTRVVQVLAPADLAPSDEFRTVGGAVAIDGDTVAFSVARPVVPLDHGSVFVFVRSGDTWSQQAELVPPAGEPSGWSATRLALSGNTLVVSAPEEFFGDPPPGQRHGRAYVFVRDAGAWQLQATLDAETPLDDDRFGTAVALDGDTFVAAVNVDRQGTFEGIIEVFEREGTSWQRTQRIAALQVPEAQSAHTTVFSLALSGDMLATGVIPYVNDPGQRAQIFERREGSWEPTAQLVGDQRPELFGATVALQGSTLVVGDPYLGSGSVTQSSETVGGAYVFERGCDGSWTQRASLAPDPRHLCHNFGARVAIDGARIAVACPDDATHASGIDGALGERTWDDDYGGSVYVFGPTDTGYEPLNFLKPSAEIVREKDFGTTIAADAEQVIVGAPGQDTVYVFR